MQHRPLAVFGITLLVCSVITGIIGLAKQVQDLTVSGVLLSVPAATALVVAALRQQGTATEDALNEAHSAGYTLALKHVAAGLLDAPHPTPGTPHHTGADVIPLRPYDAEHPPEREAL